MRLTHHGHACVRVETAGGVVVVDPGAYSDVDTALDGADVVLVTHEHPDHADPGRLAAALDAAPRLQLCAPAVVAAAVLDAGAPAERVSAVAPGDVHEAGGATVRVGGALHAVIHPDITRIVNVTYVVEADGRTVYHPGDSLDRPESTPRVDVLLLPVSGPWLRLADAIDLARDVDPHHVVPIHEALLSDVGHASVDRLLDTARLGGTYTYRRLGAGDTLDV